MAYVALKPCCFAGQRFKIGEEIPDGLVHPGNAQNVVKMGVIAKQNNTAENVVVPDPAQVETMTVVIRANEGDLPLNLTQEGLQAVVDALTVKPADAAAIIEKMEDGDALILLHIVDVRKAVKEAAEERAKALNADEDEAQTPAINNEESAGDQ